LPAGNLPPLAQRLERRKQASILQHGTIDSWDFPTTLFFPSPTQSVFHRSQLDGAPEGIDEQEEKEDVWDEKTGCATLEDSDNGSGPNFKMEHEQITVQDAETAPTAHVISPNKPSPDAGHPVAALNPESSSAKISTLTRVTSPTATATSVSVPVLPNEVVSPPPNQSLWRRFRRSTGHSKETTQA
jgi:hypothetical protein